MRRHPLHLRTWLVPLGFVLAAASCSSPTEIGGYTVTYRVNTTGVATLDSLKYDNGTGTMVKVTAPSVTYSVSLTVATGTTVEAHVYGKGTAAGTTAKLVVVWMTATGTLSGDSTTATTAAATAFTMDLGPRHL
jgi:hypothetical protein